MPIIDRAQPRARHASQRASRTVGTILVKARDGADIERWPRSRSRALLRQRHRLQPDQDDDFTVRNLAEVFAAQEATQPRA